MIQHQVTHLACVPSFFKLFVHSIDGEKAAQLRLKTIGLGLEDCPKDYVARARKILPNTRIFNRYGPTETTVIVSGCEITDSILRNSQRIPIGCPHQNVTFHAFRDDGCLIEPGDVGELHIGGIQVMQCYWNDPALTRKHLLKDLVPGEIVYRTGDFVTKNSAGEYIFLGRVDQMIKRHGYRVYLTEISDALSRLAFVRDAACVASKASDLTTITAFVVLSCEVSQQALRDELSGLLPAYMLPDRFVTVDTLPLNAVGKLDTSVLFPQHFRVFRVSSRTIAVARVKDLMESDIDIRQATRTDIDHLLQLRRALFDVHGEFDEDLDMKWADARTCREVPKTENCHRGRICRNMPEPSCRLSLRVSRRTDDARRQIRAGRGR